MTSHSLHNNARRILTAVILVLALLGAGIQGASVAGASTSVSTGTSSGAGARAAAGGCTRTVTGAHHGALRARSGVLCLRNATQLGPVTVTGGARLQASGSVIGGALTLTRAGAARVCQTTLLGPVRAERDTGPVTFGGQGSCGGDIGHAPVAITGSAGPVHVTGLRQQGTVDLAGNTGGVTLSAASVAGTTTISGNRGRVAVIISGNTITGSLSCSANKPAPGDAGKPNTVSGTAGGQCATLTTGPGVTLGAEPPLSQDLSATLPNLNYGQAVGDFTGTGHDELAYYQDGQLKIANVVKFGGDVVRSTPSDLRTTPNNGFHHYDYDWPVWSGSAYASAGSTYGLTSVKVAASASNIYMTGATWTNNNQEAASYKLHLYKLPHGGSCASASCAAKTVDLPSIFDYHDFFHLRNDVIVATSLAVGVVGGRTLIAVGLSDDGIYIFDDNLQLVAIIADMGVAGTDPPEQTPVTALAFGPPSGPGQGGVLAAGVMSSWEDMFSYRLTPDGHEQSMTHSGGSWLTLAAAVAKINGQLYAVYGTNTGAIIIFVINVDTGAELTRYTYPSTQVGDQPSGLAPLTPWNGAPDNQEVVLGTFGGARDAVLQDVGGALTALPVGPGGATTGTADQVYAWWPGYAAGQLRVANSSAGPVTVAMASRTDPGFGCWLDTSVDGGAAAFPVADTTVPAGGVSADYFAGALTAGVNGDCAAAQGTGEHSAYVIITPVGDSTDEHLVKLVAGYDGTLSITDQTGGYLTAALTQTSSAPGSWGSWQLTVTGGSTPAAAAPTVQGFRLTSAPDPQNYQPPATPVADDPCRPVYRFDVAGARWDHVISAGQVAAQIPPMTAQGSTDGGKTWKDLGQLMPSADPVLAGDDPTLAGDTITLGPASFYWQDPPGSASPPWAAPSGQGGLCPANGTAPLTDVRVLSGGVPSNTVVLANLTAPPENGGPGATPLQGIQVTPETPGGTAVPRSDGVDQAALDVKLTPASSGGIIQPSDPRYSLVYYRYATTNNLVTGLYAPGDYGDYIAVGPYPAIGGGSSGQVVKNYLVTTSTAAQTLNGVINDSGTATGALVTGGGNGGSSINVAALRNPLTVTGTAAGGISITGCTTPTGICPLTTNTGRSLVLYQAGDPGTGPVTGVQLFAWANTARGALPLKVDPANADRLGSAPLYVFQAKAQLQANSVFLPSDSIDTALVTSGDLIPALSVPVGNG